VLRHDDNSTVPPRDFILRMGEKNSHVYQHSLLKIGVPCGFQADRVIQIGNLA